jgi:hypothetical protein
MAYARRYDRYAAQKLRTPKYDIRIWPFYRWMVCYARKIPASDI